MDIKKLFDYLVFTIALIFVFISAVYLQKYSVSILNDSRAIYQQLQEKDYELIGNITGIKDLNSGSFFDTTSCILVINNTDKILTGNICYKVEIGKQLYMQTVESKIYETQYYYRIE